MCVFPTSDSRATARVAAALNRALKAADPAGPWQIAVGRAYPGVNGVARSMADALEALEVSARLGRAAPVVYAGDLLVYQVLGRDRQALAELVDSVLGPMGQARGGAARYCRPWSVTSPWVAWPPKRRGICTFRCAP